MLREDLDEEELIYVFTNQDYLVTAFEEGHIGVKPTTIDALERARHCSIVKVIITAYGALEKLHEASIDLAEGSTLSDISTTAFFHLATRYLANGEQGW